MQVVFAFIAVAVVGGLLLLGLLEFFSSERRAVRGAKKNNAKELLATRRQLFAARDSLIRIASNESGHPVLEAQNALTEMSRIELKELES